ncbi:MAG: Hsp20/alpha crystallin family protein [Treponema sp.]|jgi:HSP20 family molecular chaperone IbpA|nr:Hsp20/alpha crystallin family protein [Treponema sp.]
MKGAKMYPDLGTIFDEIFEAAQDFKNELNDELNRNFSRYGNRFGEGGPFPRGGPFGKGFFDENADFYPNYSYPPMNVYMTADRTLVFEFALAGFNEKDISLSFQGDYMVFSAVIPRNSETSHDAEEMVRIAENETGENHDETENRPCGDSGGGENVRYFKRRLKLKDIEKQKYFVPLDKYAQENVRAVYKNGILTVSVPPKDEPDQGDGVKIEIIREEA